MKTLSQQHDNLRTFVIYEKPLPEDRPDASGFINQEILRTLLPAQGDVELYFLGPKPFMSCVSRLADNLSIPTSQRHYEFFGPAEELKTAG